MKFCFAFVFCFFVCFCFCLILLLLFCFLFFLVFVCLIDCCFFFFFFFLSAALNEHSLWQMVCLQALRNDSKFVSFNRVCQMNTNLRLYDSNRNMATWKWCAFNQSKKEKIKMVFSAWFYIIVNIIIIFTISLSSSRTESKKNALIFLFILSSRSTFWNCNFWTFLISNQTRDWNLCSWK